MKKMLNKILKYADAIILLVISIAFGVNHNWGGAAGFMMAALIKVNADERVERWKKISDITDRWSTQMRDKYWELKYGHKYNERK